MPSLSDIRKYALPVICLALVCTSAAAQESPATAVLRAINNATLSESCKEDGRGRLISNRALNIYLSDRIGYYLSNGRELSLYKNSVVFDGLQRSVSLNHNLYTASEQDERVRSMVTVGVRATAYHELGFQ